MSQLVRDNPRRDPDRGDDVSPASCAACGGARAASRAGEEKAIGREGILGTQEAETIHQLTNERIHRDHALGFQLAEGHMDGPALWADMAETIEG